MSARSQDTPVSWVPISQLSPLARALLGDLGDRDVVPGHVADRVTGLAKQWAAAGFTDRTVHLWEELRPADAAHLNNAGVDPARLDDIIDDAGTTYRRALATGRLTAEAVAERLLKPAGGFPRPPVPESKQDAKQEQKPATSGLFSHVAGADPDSTPAGRRPKPTHTPFNT